MHRICSVFAALSLSWLTATPASALAEGAATSTIRRANKSIFSLLSKKVAKGSKEEKSVQVRLSKTLTAFIDFDALAERSLGKHWESRTPAERAEFVTILRDLIERNYLKTLRDNLGYRLEYRDEKVDGDRARVRTVVKVTTNGRTEEVSIDYDMQRGKGGWRVIDVITDEVSIVRNYRSQFNRIIRKDSYEMLVKKMRDKLKTI